jgi:hypothetical protein
VSPLFIAGRQRPKILEPIDVAFHHVAALVGFCVEFWGSASPTALLQSSLLRILAFGTDTDDLAASQLLAVLPRTIRTVYAQDRWSFAGAARTGPPNSDLVKQWQHVSWVAGLTFRDKHRKWTALSVAQDVDFTVSAPSADSEPLVFDRPLFSSMAGCFRAPTALRWALQLVLSSDAPSQSIFP